MGNIIRNLVTDSFGDSKYAQALEALAVMRDELINMDEPKMFNSFVRDLKMKLLSGTLGGDRREFWFKVRWSKLGLIDNEASEPSDVKPEEAEGVSACRRDLLASGCADLSPSSTPQSKMMEIFRGHSLTRKQ